MRAWRTLTRVALPMAVRHLGTHRRPVAVTTFALACGVGAVLATHLLHASVIGSYAETVQRFSGRAAFQVTNGSSGVAEEMVEAVASVPGVRAAVPSVEGFVSWRQRDECEGGHAGSDGERLYLYGVDLLADRQVRDYEAGDESIVDDPLVFIASPDSVALTADFARERDLAIGDPVCVLTPSGTVSLTIRALLGRQRGPASALDGRLAVVDLSVAQDLLQTTGRVSTIAIVTAPDADLEAVRREAASRVDGHGVVESPQSRVAAFGRLLANYRWGLLVAAALAMLVALSFVVGIASIAVEARRRELGLLRVVGLRRRDLVAVVMVEMLVLAAIASVIGVGLGVGVARLSIGDFGLSAAALYGEGPHTGLRIDWRAVAAIATLGAILPLVAISGSLRRMAGVRPLALLATAATGGARVPRHRLATLAGVGVVLGTGAVWHLRGFLGIAIGVAGTIAMIGAVTGAALCVPGMVATLVTLADRWATAGGRAVPLLACRALRAEARPIAVTCAALLLALAGAISVSAWIASLDATLQAAFDTTFANVDAVVSAGAEPYAVGGTQIPRSVSRAIGDLPGVAFADAVRVTTGTFEGTAIAVVASDAALHRQGRRRLFMIEGDADGATRALVAGTGVVVNRTFARRFSRNPGDAITLATPTGPLRLRIAGIHLDLTPGDLGIVRMDRELYRRWWRDDSASVVEVSLRQRRDREQVIAAIRARWGARHGLLVLTLAEVRDEYGAMLDRLARLVQPLLAITLASALVGTVSARAASLTARRRTSGILRALGVTRRQLARLFAMEAAAVMAMAVGAAVIVGSALGRLQVEILLRGMLGMFVVYAYPHRVAWLGGAALVLTGSAAGWLYGRRTGRVAFREALQCE